MWLIIPGIIVGLMVMVMTVIAFTVLSKPSLDIVDDGDPFIVFIALLFILFLVSIILCPISYYVSRTDALRFESYYEQIVEPAIVEEYEDYVVIQNLESAIWQAGNINLSQYNSYLKTTRYWDSVPVIGSVIFGPPEYLKNARVLKGDL